MPMFSFVIRRFVFRRLYLHLNDTMEAMPSVIYFFFAMSQNT
jgi:hypothetical protein